MALPEFLGNDQVQGLTEDRGSAVTEHFLGSLAPGLDDPRSVHNQYRGPIIHGRILASPRVICTEGRWWWKVSIWHPIPSIWGAYGPRR